MVLASLPISPAFAVLRHPDMTDAQAKAVAALPQFDSRAKASSVSTGCTASVLNSEWAVFAAHCIELEDEQRVNVYYIVDNITYIAPGTAYRTQSADGGYDDVALIKFDTPLPQAVSWVAPYDRFDEYAQLGWQLGRGTSGELGGTLQSDGIFRGMTQRIISTTLETSGGEGASITPQHIYYNYNLSPENDPAPEYTTRYEGGTGPGDSGGPLYVYSRGRFFNASVVSGPQSGSYRNGRLSTHVPAIVARTGFEFAYPQALQPLAVWVAEDLTPALADASTVSSWEDRLQILSWSNSSDGGAGTPKLLHASTPTGLASVRFDGDDALGLSLDENVVSGQTSFSVAMVVRADVDGEGLQVDPFGGTGVLDASSADNAWSISYSHNGRYGLSIEDRDDSVASIYRGGVSNDSLGDGNWHVLIATWDGSELSFDNAGDDRNMKLYIDSVDQIREGQGSYHFDVARGASSLRLGDSQTNALAGFQGDIAEIRIYAGELQKHEVDRLLSGLRERYVSGTPGVVFERPWSSQVSLDAGHSLQTRGLLTGGGHSIVWSVESGPGAVTFSNIYSADTEIHFEAVGTYQLRANVSNGVSTGFSELTVEVLLPDASAPAHAPSPIEGAWIRSDIGGTGIAGSATEAAGTWTLNAAGSGVGIGEGETYDEGHFVWKAVAGDFDWVARLDSIDNVSGPTRAGLMVRGGAGPTDAAAFIGFAPDNTAYALFRHDGGWYADLLSDATVGSVPAWLKLERRGDLVTAYISSDGSTFTPIDRAYEIKLPGVARVGFFATSGNETASIAAVFSQLDLNAVSRPKASKVELDRALWAGAEFEAYTQLSGSDEPWLSVESAQGFPELDFQASYRSERHVMVADSGGSGDYRVRLAVDDGNTLSFIERSEAIRFNTYYEFTEDANTEGWGGVNVTDLTTSGGQLTATANTNDPQINIAGLSLAGARYTQVAVRMRSDDGGPVQLFWSHSTAAGFAAARSVTVNYNTPGSYETVIFDLSTETEWEGKTITGLRLDPINGTVNGVAFEIDYIEVSDGLPRPQQAPGYYFEQGAHFEDWQATKDMTGLRVLGGSLKGTSSGTDPVLTNDVDDFSADAATGLLIRMAASTNGAVDFFWSTSDNPSFAASRRVTASYAGSGNFQTLYFPLAGNANWDGQTISKLRIDPTTASAVDFQVDAIVFSAGDADADTMPDSYESDNALDALDADDASMDADFDGANNDDEFIAGTNPQDAGDRLRVLTLVQEASHFELSLDGKAGRAYQLVRKLELSETDWLEVDSVAPLSVDSAVTLEDASVFDKAFYRVEVSYP